MEYHFPFEEPCYDIYSHAFYDSNVEAEIMPLDVAARLMEEGIILEPLDDEEFY